VLGTLGVAGGLAMGLVLSLGACSRTSEPDAPPESPTGDYHASATDNDHAPLGTESPVLTWRRADQRAAVAAGVRVMRAFASPAASSRSNDPDAQETWWAKLHPLLSDQARSDYAAVDHANVPVHAVTGPGRLGVAQARVMAVIHVPTDAGLYAVTLSRSAEDPRWRAEQITPPEIDPHGVGEEPHSSGTGAGESEQ
jgi:hypothetical protein